MKDQIQFQKDEALFEQRKLASKDDLKYAESRIEMMHQMEARLQSEMDKLLELSQFVSTKDAEAKEKLAEAASLYAKAQELESVLMADAEVIEHEKEKLERERHLLVQERVAVLKERSMNISASGSAMSHDSIGPRLSSSFVSTPDVVLKKKLASIKSQINRLRD